MKKIHRAMPMEVNDELGQKKTRRIGLDRLSAPLDHFALWRSKQEMILVELCDNRREGVVLSR